MQGVRKNQDELRREFGVSRRLAVRVGALLSKRVAATATLLEMAAPGGPVEKMLLHPSLLAAGADLDEATLARLAQESGAEAEGPFALARDGDWTVVGLEEERLAQGAWGEAEGDDPSTALAKAGDDAAVAFGEDEARGLFTPEELARLKMEALTAGDSAGRIAALRKLRLAPLGPKEKGGIFLRVLLDPISPARAEAIKGLEELGFDRDTAEAIQDMLESSGPARRSAIERISALMDSLGQGERQIVLRALLEGLREFDDEDARSHVLRVMGEAVLALAETPALLEETVRLCLRKAVELPEQGAAEVRSFLYRLAAANPSGMDHLLWRGLETMREANARSFVLTLLAQLDLDDAQRRRAAEAMLDAIQDEDLDELNRQKTGHNLVRFGRTALDMILGVFPSAGARERERLVGLLDMLAADGGLGAAAANQVAAAFLEGLKVADRRLRMAISHTRAFGLPGVSAKVRREAAATLIAQVPHTEHPDALDRLGDVLESLGADAVEPMVRFLRDARPGGAADLVARRLGRVVAQLAEEGRPVSGLKGLLAFLRKRVEDPKTRCGGYVVALGSLAASGAESPEAARSDADLLTAHLGRPGEHADAIEAMGLLAASPVLDPERRLRLLQILTEIVRGGGAESDSAGMKEIETPEGLLYEFSGQVAFDSEALPAAVEALERACLAEANTEAVKARIVSELAAVWEDVAEWRVVWGPKSSERLALALARIGARPETPPATCLAIARAMKRQLHRISVVRAMDLLYCAELDEEDFLAVAAESGLELLEQWNRSVTAPEEREDVLAAAARIAAMPSHNPRGQAARRLRRRAADQLFEALGEGYPWAWRQLEMLRDCPTAPAAYREEIAERLREAAALVRLEG